MNCPYCGVVVYIEGGKVIERGGGLPPVLHECEQGTEAHIMHRIANTLDRIAATLDGVLEQLQHRNDNHDSQGRDK